MTFKQSDYRLRAAASDRRQMRGELDLGQVIPGIGTVFADQRQNLADLLGYCGLRHVPGHPGGVRM
ncbi:hypothetical protein [Lysobacter gummosus]|uniref:hypothetical protein n=1 Tax=Lysobacter gummosus TaxID=262324 RepID=UPI0036292451